MKDTRLILVIILVMLITNIVNIQSVSCKNFDIGFFDGDRPREPPPWNTLLPYMLLAKTILSSVNSVLLIILLTIYVGIYRKTRSEFSIGLIIFNTALLLYALTSNPLIHMLTGFRLSGLGPFTMLPDLFTCIASAILLYLSRQ